MSGLKYYNSDFALKVDCNVNLLTFSILPPPLRFCSNCLYYKLNPFLSYLKIINKVRFRALQYCIVHNRFRHINVCSETASIDRYCNYC